jgi:hypothetical protein
VSDQGQNHDRTPIEEALEHARELFVYAPIGLLFEGASLFPQLVEKGKNQVTMARMIGKFAVDQGRTEATKAAGKLQDQAAGVLDFIGESVTPVPAEDVPAAAPTPAPRKPTTAAKVAQTASKAAARVVSAASLAIPDYDGLSASQVVNRLAGLSAPELRSVQLYEAANRGRKTILSKVAQLQGS